MSEEREVFGTRSRVGSSRATCNVIYVECDVRRIRDVLTAKTAMFYVGTTRRNAIEQSALAASTA